jgi:hypothetical protein
MATKKRKQKFVPKIGQKVECLCSESKRESAWLYPFTGYVARLYERSAIVVIQSTHKRDDHLVIERHGRTVVPFEEMEGRHG